ncbi:hypothetical protein C2U70_26310 [Bradyrhizobium guangdongense]|nr:hypothetical protein C2U70_26310 [Bradyrhizobium guangdongense]
MDWQPIATAPIAEDLELSVIENAEVHSLVFPCRRSEDGWVDCQTKRLVPIHPTHWRFWGKNQS